MSFTRRYLTSILVLTAAVQATIILYNNATGYIVLHGLMDVLFRLGFGTAFSAPVAVVIVLLDETIVHRLDRNLLWEHHFVPRLAVETFLAAATGALLGAALTALVDQISPYKDGLLKNIVNNALITAVLNLIILAVVEAAISHGRGRAAREAAETLERDNARIRFDSLKAQLNPHFLFNSLNVLSSLVRTDAERAERFIDAFALVYRYTLEVIEQPVVELAREVEFARSYLYLLEIRFENSITVDSRIAAAHFDMIVPPLSIQTILENVFKHNRVSEESPMHIRMESSDDWLTIANTLQPKDAAGTSTGLGLRNLRKRYAFLGAPEPRFEAVNGEFVAGLPLLKAE